MSPAAERPDGRQPVAYLGPQGTFSEEALLASAQADAVAPVARPTIHDAVAALRRGEVRWAIVPIENSLEGSITVTLDLLAEDAAEVQIVAETVLRVRHCLIAARMLAPEEIDTVLTHPQVPGQCTRLLQGELAGARVEPASSTAEAVRAVAAGERAGLAAIGTRLAADVYGARVIRADVQDRDDNETRFVWLARANEAGEPPPLARPPGREWKTSLVFWGQGAQRPGWLAGCLDELARREINLTKIESRPRRERLGSYMFFADVAGRLRDARVAQALEGLSRHCEEVRVLGCYPASERDAERAA